jgi:hypothetical protein
MLAKQGCPGPYIPSCFGPLGARTSIHVGGRTVGCPLCSSARFILQDDRRQVVEVLSGVTEGTLHGKTALVVQTDGVFPGHADPSVHLDGGFTHLGQALACLRVPSSNGSGETSASLRSTAKRPIPSGVPAPPGSCPGSPRRQPGPWSTSPSSQIRLQQRWTLARSICTGGAAQILPGPRRVRRRPSRPGGRLRNRHRAR